MEEESVLSLGSGNHGNGISRYEEGEEEEERSNGQYHMPFTLVKEELQQRLQQKISLLRDRLQKESRNVTLGMSRAKYTRHDQGKVHMYK